MPARKILLVEGIDDEHVMKHLCGNRGGPQLDVVPLGGIDRLVESVPVRLKASNDGEVFGVVVDADTNLAGRWRSLRDGLIRIGYQHVPEDPSETGTIVEPPSGSALPRVGFWLMPDNRTSGILEDFLQFLIPRPTPLFERVRTTVASIPAEERRFGQTKESKAVVHTWLAWQEEPGRPFGVAITARYLEPAVPQVDTLIHWLNTLFR